MIKIYLAIPYSGMEESSYEQANLATILLLNMGYNVMSPITHCHSLQSVNGYDLPSTWEFWKEIDFEFIDWADEVYVLVPKEGMERVDNSVGVQAEIKYTISCDKSVTLISMEALKEMYKELK